MPQSKTMLGLGDCSSLLGEEAIRPFPSRSTLALFELFGQVQSAI